MKFDVAVIGAGINGLSTAYHLLRRNAGKVVVLEQFRLGHNRGSSHGFSRITRSTYSSAKYVELVQVAHDVEWPALERASGKQLLFPTPGCFFGPDLQKYEDSVRAVPDVCARLDFLTPAEAREVFPHFTFVDSERVIRDNTCALVAASDTMEFLGQAVVKLGGTILEDHPVRFIEPSRPILLETPSGRVECQNLVLTAGSWTARLIRSLGNKLRVAHQDVGYFEFDRPSGLGKFPVWVYAGPGESSYYGLPQFRRPGIKLAHHRTGMHEDDPDRQLQSEMPPDAEPELAEFAQKQFAFPLRRVGYEPCLYTNTVTEDFLLDHWPEDQRVVVGAGFSGHGFKFGPLTGRILAELLLDGKTSVAAFEKYRSEFRFSTLPDWPACRAEA